MFLSVRLQCRLSRPNFIYFLFYCCAKKSCRTYSLIIWKFTINDPSPASTFITIEIKLVMVDQNMLFWLSTAFQLSAGLTYWCFFWGHSTMWFVGQGYLVWKSAHYHEVTVDTLTTQPGGCSYVMDPGISLKMIPVRLLDLWPKNMLYHLWKLNSSQL